MYAVRGTRLEFERQVLIGPAVEASRQPSRPIPWKGLARAAMAGLLAAGLALAGAGVFRFLASRDPEKAALAQTARLFVAAMQAYNLDAAIELCSAGAAGGKLVRGDVVRVTSEKARPPESSAEIAKLEQDRMRAALRGIWKSATELGMDWKSAAPVAAGGVRADVCDPGSMIHAATVLTGEIYVSSGQALFSVEFSARYCAATFVVTDLWKCERLNITPSSLEADVVQHQRAFQSEPAPPGDGVQITGTRPLFTAVGR